MTAQEKCIIETILADVGLEPLYSRANDRELKTKPNQNEWLVNRHRSEYSIFRNKTHFATEPRKMNA